MTTFDDRQKSFENKYAHDEEVAFRVHARTLKLLGAWAADKMGMAGVEMDAYAKEVVIADFEMAGDDDVIQKVKADLAAAGITVSEHDIRLEMERLRPVAREQITGAK